jgi:phage major head subunit gpT-like protein
MGTMLNRAKVEAAQVGFRTVFENALNEAPALYDKLAMRVDSNNPTEQYNWMGGYPQLKEWLGDRSLQKLTNYNWQIVNKDYAAGIEVDRNDIEDDNIGLVRPKIQGLAAAAKRHYDELLFELLKAGFATACYDGQYFFDTDHSEGLSGTQSNKVTTVFDANGVALEAGYLAMGSLKGEDGQPLDVTPTHLIVPTALTFTAKKVVQAEYLASGATNIYRGLVEVVEAKRLNTNPTYWFLADLSKPVKGLVLQVRRPLEFSAQDSPTDENAFMRRVYRYGVDGRHNAGYGLWQLMYGSTGAG